MDEIVTKQNKIISYLTFKIGDEVFALNVGEIINILEMQKITKVPNMPEFMPGVINLRGEVLPIIDTNIKLGLSQTKFTSNTCILVIDSKVEDKSVRFGILVDMVQEVLEFENNMILLPPNLGENYKSDLITGVVEQDDRFIMIVDINKLLDTSEIINIRKITPKKTEK